MKTLRATFDLELIHNELSPEEKDPELHIFWDNRFDKDGVTKTGLSAAGITVEGRLNVATKEIPQTASVVFSAFAWRRNDQGAACLMDVGTNHVPVAALMQQKEFDVPLIMHTVQNYEKAIVRVRVRDVDLADVKVVPRKFVGSELLPYIQGLIGSEQQMADTIPGTEMMRVPYDYSESGLELTGGVPLPAIAYVMSPTPKTNEYFWQNAFETVMDRDMLTPGQWVRLTKKAKARTMALMCCYVSQYLDYVSDTVDRNKFNQRYVAALVQGCENFGDSLATWSGDCEDLGTGILQSYNALIGIKFKDPVLTEIQTIARQYVPLLSLDVVNGAQVKDENSPKGAHMNINLVPVHEYRQWLRKTEEGAALDAKHATLYPSEIDAELPFMVGEGTGKLEPLGYDDPYLPLMAYVYRCPSFRTFKKPISRKRNEAGAFLLGSLKGFTDFYIRRGLPIGSMVYCTLQGDGSVTRGAYYEDMMREANNVTVRMDAPVSKNTMDVINEAILLRDPPHDLVLTRGKLHPGEERNEHLDHVVEEVEDFRRQPGDNPYSWVAVYVRPHQIDSQIASDIVRDLRKLDRVYKVDYNLEKITDEIWGYRLRIFVQ